MSTATTPLRVAMISYYMPSGSKIGVGYQVHELANALVTRGHSVTVFSPCSPSAGALYEAESVALEGSNRTFKFALRLRHVDWTRFDVLHAHGDDYWLWRRRVPAHVRTLHGSCLSEARWIPGMRERLRMVLLGLSEILASLVADETVAVSDSTRRWLPWVRSVVPNGVDLRRFHPGDQSTSPSLLFVGTYRRRKRGKLLAEVFQRDVLPALPTAELWMVCEDAEPQPGVKVLGRVSDDDLAELYRRAWAFCLPSTYEGFGIPYVEAMASGCPVVATPNPGALEVTRNGTLGVIVDDDRLGETLVRLLSSSADRERLAQDALVGVSRYDLRSVAATYERIYLRLLDARPKVDAGSSRTLVLRRP
jgi:phosphatidylinositol alpha-mannosyltransferase